MFNAEIKDTLRRMLDRRKVQASGEAELILALAERVDAALARAEKTAQDIEALKTSRGPDEVTDLVTEVRMLEDRIERAAEAIKEADRWARVSQVVRTESKLATWVKAEGIQKSRGLHRHTLVILGGGKSEWVGGEPPADFSWEADEPAEEKAPAEKAPEPRTKKKRTKKKATKKKATKKKTAKKKTAKKKTAKKKATKKKVADETFLTLAEVSEIARTPLSSVRAWCRDGRLASCKPGRRRMVRESDLTVFLKTSPVPRTKNWALLMERVGHSVLKKKKKTPGVRS